MSGLSEKAKGKRRAIEQDQDGEAPPPVPQGRTLTIRFSEGLPDLHLLVGPNDNVREIQRKIRNERPGLARRRLRLIHSGRLLTNGTLVHSWLTSLEERQKRALVRDTSTAPDVTSPTATNTAAGSGVWLHCSVGPEIPDGEADDDRVQTSQLTPLRGFDRLATAGFTPEDIANVRRQFHVSRGIGNDGDAPVDGALQESTDDNDEHARALEEQWIDDMDGAANPADISLSDEGGPIYSTLLHGILLGFFFPLLPFFFMRAPRPAAFFSDAYQAVEGPPNVVFSRRMLMAICVGFVSNVAYGALRTFTV